MQWDSERLRHSIPTGHGRRWFAINILSSHCSAWTFSDLLRNLNEGVKLSFLECVPLDWNATGEAPLVGFVVENGVLKVVPNVVLVLLHVNFPAVEICTNTNS